MSPHREQPTGNTMAPRHLGDVGALLEALRYDPRLLLAAPQPASPLPGDHLDTTIPITFLPGIRHAAVLREKQGPRAPHRLRRPERAGRPKQAESVPRPAHAL